MKQKGVTAVHNQTTRGRHPPTEESASKDLIYMNKLLLFIIKQLTDDEKKNIQTENREESGSLMFIRQLIFKFSGLKINNKINLRFVSL